MKIKFNTDELLPKIGNCVAIVNPKNTLPILCDLLIESNDLQHDIVITASDGETWLSYRANVVETDKMVRFCVNATDIYKALSNLKGKMVEMNIDDNKHILTCVYDNGNFSLPFESPTDFPKAISIDENDETATTKILTCSDILHSVGKTSFAIANDELRPVMNGIHFDFFSDGMVSVASDGHKLVKLKNKKVTFENTDDNTVKGFTLPKKPSTSLVNILSTNEGHVKLTFNDRVVVVNNSEFRLTTRLIEGKFPNYDSVIPKDNNIKVTIPKNDFINALKRVLPMSNASSELISLKFTPQMLNIGAVDFDFSKSANESLSCDYTDFEMVIGFKGSTLLATLQNIDGESVSMCLKDPTRATLFVPTVESENNEYISLLMPMLVQ